MKGYALDGDVIVLHRELTHLDRFVNEFLKILKKHTDYLLVSGFVSIATGRPRGTEDVDILVPLLDKDAFQRLFTDLLSNGFWCYQGDAAEDADAYFRNLQSIRFARNDELFPNMEVIPITERRTAKHFEFTHPQRLRIEDVEFKIPPPEFEILYMEIVLKGTKDLEDAKHLRTLFAPLLQEKRFREYEPIVRGELR